MYNICILDMQVRTTSEICNWCMHGINMFFENMFGVHGLYSYQLITCIPASY